MDFSFAALVFADPMHCLVYDRHEDGEDRWNCVGAVAGGFRVLVVVRNYRDAEGVTTIRIIGLRQTTKRERSSYEGAT